MEHSYRMSQEDTEDIIHSMLQYTVLQPKNSPLMGFRSTPNLINAFALFIFSSFFLGLSNAKDTITSVQFVRDSQTVSSNNSDFKLGFFSPQNSTNRYVGIWYLSEINIVWVANRNQPLKDSSGIFTISEDGNLVVLNGQNLVLWSSNVSNNATNSTAQVLDSGNLVLRDDKTGETIWESFEHPCDAAVPNMKISANRITGKKIQFISWKSRSDPSNGYFTGSIERLDVPEVFFWANGTRPYWRTGPWNGKVFIGSPQMSTGYMYGWTLFNQEDGTVYLTYNFLDQAMFGILALNPEGKLLLVRYYNKKEYMREVLEQTDCDRYSLCGEFGSCNQQSSPICSCLTGFEPRNSEEWNRLNWTSGCVRKAPLMCESLKNGSGVGEEDGFLKFPNMKVPDFAERSAADEEGKCGTDCLANCSCLAYAYDSGIGCMYWSRDLIDIQRFSKGGGIDLYIRLAHSELEKHSPKKRDKRAIIAITVSIGAIALAASAYLAVCTYHGRRKWTPKHKENQNQRVTEVQKQVKLDELPLFNFQELASATDNFHLANKLGKGGFGSVYKGKLQDGREIAVKRLSRASRQGQEEFMNEVVVISKLQHRNLVRLLGCCIEGEEKMLIYEFMPNKSLDAFLFDPIQRKLLDWRKRFNIIEGIARGMIYLHRDSRLRIIHRDLKASNILLDGEMNPKISDFGLARIFGGSEDEVNTMRVVGTYGYMSPEYAMEGLFSEKSDVYSFGVLLLEIVSGRRNTSFNNNEQCLSLIGFAWKLWNEENIVSLIDGEIWDGSNEKDILKCIHIGLLCVQEIAKERPSMTNVVSMLTSEIAHLPPPKQVAFVQKQSVSGSDSSQEPQPNSHNSVTLTDIQGR